MNSDEFHLKNNACSIVVHLNIIYLGYFFGARKFSAAYEWRNEIMKFHRNVFKFNFFLLFLTNNIRNGRACDVMNELE